LQSSEKIAGANSMNLIYLLSPADPHFTLNSDSIDFTSMISFPGSEEAIVLKPAFIDPLTG
jgi:hypothetical protein